MFENRLTEEGKMNIIRQVLSNYPAISLVRKIRKLTIKLVILLLALHFILLIISILLEISIIYPILGIALNCGFLSYSKIPHRFHKYQSIWSVSGIYY